MTGWQISPWQYRIEQLTTSRREQRLQGKPLVERQNSADTADPIMVYPDVRRMLLRQKGMVEGSRAMAYWTAMLRVGLKMIWRARGLMTARIG